MLSDEWKFYHLLTLQLVGYLADDQIQVLCIPRKVQRVRGDGQDRAEGKAGNPIFL